MLCVAITDIDIFEVIDQAEYNDPLSTIALGRVDAIVFTGGIGEHASKVREMVCEGLNDSIGLEIDSSKNQLSTPDNQEIQSERSKIKLFIIPTNEELEIVLQTQNVIDS